MNDKLYKQRRDLFIKREKFESRLIRYLERLVAALEVKCGRLPKHLDFLFTAADEDTCEPVKSFYSSWADDLFKNMKQASDEELVAYNNILDDFHHELDEYEEEYKKASHNGYFTKC